MATPPTLRQLVAAIIVNEGDLMADFPGGVLARIPQTGTGMVATSGAFWPAGHPEAGKLKNTIAVLDGGDDLSPGGLGQRGFVGYPLVYGYVTANEAGETLLARLDERLHLRFNRGVSYPRNDDAGSMVEFVTLERQPTRDADDFGYPGRMFAIWRIQGTYVRPAL